MYECFHCGQKAVYWMADFDYSDFGYEGDGIVHMCHCAHGGADITYQIPCDDPEDEPEEPEDVMPGWDLADAPEWNPAE